MKIKNKGDLGSLCTDTKSWINRPTQGGQFFVYIKRITTMDDSLK